MQLARERQALSLRSAAGEAGHVHRDRQGLTVRSDPRSRPPCGLVVIAGAPSSACCLRRASTPPRAPPDLADQAGEAEHIALAIQPDSSVARRQRVHSVRERPRRIRTEACHDGLAIVVRRQKVDAMDHEPRAVCLRTILAQAKQRVANSNRDARANVPRRRRSSPACSDVAAMAPRRRERAADKDCCAHRCPGPYRRSSSDPDRQTGSDRPTCGQVRPCRPAPGRGPR